MIPPDLAVQAGSAIPRQTVPAIAGTTDTTTVFLRLQTSVLAGLALTVVAWLALVLVVVHGRYVTEAVAAGEYRKGPFAERRSEEDPDATRRRKARRRHGMSDGSSPFGETEEVEGADFARELSLFDIVVIGIGAMVGGSIFVLTGLAAGESGPALVLAFALNGFITIFTGMVYAELGSAFPEPGGGYLWVRTALGRSQAFISGWMSWFAHAVAGSLYILSFGSFLTLIITEYFDVATFGLSPLDLQKLFATFAAAVFTYVNYRGAKETSRAENVVTVLQLAVLFVFIASGIAALVGQPNPTVNYEPFFPNGVGGVFLAMGLTFIAFEGYEIIVQSGREVVNPHENIPKAVFYSMLVVVTIYILVGAVLLGAVQITPELLETARQTE